MTARLTPEELDAYAAGHKQIVFRGEIFDECEKCEEKSWPCPTWLMGLRSIPTTPCI